MQSAMYEPNYTDEMAETTAIATTLGIYATLSKEPVAAMKALIEADQAV